MIAQSDFLHNLGPGFSIFFLLRPPSTCYKNARAGAGGENTQGSGEGPSAIGIVLFLFFLGGERGKGWQGSSQGSRGVFHLRSLRQILNNKGTQQGKLIPITKAVQTVVETSYGTSRLPSGCEKVGIPHLTQDNILMAVFFCNFSLV